MDEIGADGHLVAGKIEKMVRLYPNGEVEEWVGCEINTHGRVEPGKKKRKLRRNLVEKLLSGTNVRWGLVQ